MARVVTASADGTRWQSLVRDLRRGLVDFQLNLNRPGLVACSGGKDSTTLLLLLRDLGLDVVPAIVDLGYSGFDAAAIANSLEDSGLHAYILTPSSVRKIDGISAKRANQITANLNLLRDP